MKKLMKVFTFIFMVTVFFTACSDKSKETGEVKEKEKAPAEAFNPDTDPNGVDFDKVREQLGAMPKIDGTVKLGAVAKAFENEYWRTLKEGEELAAQKFKEKGYDVTLDMKSAQGEGDEQGQLSIVEDMINKKYTALLLSPISDGNLVPGVEKAKKNNIPVINVNDGIIKNADIFVGPKAIMNGELAAEWISKKIGAEGEVAIVIGMPKAFAARQRTLGFENWMKTNSPNVKIVEKQNADWDRAKAKDLAEIWIKKHPDLKAIFCNNDVMALGVQEAVNASKKDILVVGVDGIQEAYESIRRGELAATVDSFPKYKGQIAVEMALRMLGGQKLPRVIWTPQALIDSSNVNESAESIIGWEEAGF